MGMHTEVLTGKTQQKFFNPDEAENFFYWGTHAIGHARMATESGVDIKSAHPFWGYPFSDVSVVHNGQLTNYWNNRRALENKGMRFMSECDSELIAVYIAQRMREGATLEESFANRSCNFSRSNSDVVSSI